MLPVKNFIRIYTLWFFISMCFAQQPQSKDNPLTSIKHGAWSAGSISLFNTFGGFGADPNRDFSFYSPDHEKLVHVHREAVSITIAGKEYPTDFWSKSSAELGWSPDSSRFFLTWTDGGETGTWHVEVYEVSSAGLHEIKEIENGPKDNFDRYVRALPKDKSEPFWDSDQYCATNVVTSQWLNGSRELLLSVLVPNVGNCRYMSDFRVYLISVPSGKILQSYSAKEAHEKFNPKNLPLIAN